MSSNNHNNNRHYSSSNSSRYNNSYNNNNNNNNYSSSSSSRYNNRNDRYEDKRLYSDYDRNNDNNNNYRGGSNSGGYKQQPYKQRSNNYAPKLDNFYFAMDKTLGDLANNAFYQVQIVPLENAFNGNYTNSISLFEYISNFHLYNLYSNLLSRHEEISEKLNPKLCKFLGIVPRLEVELERSLSIASLRQYQRELLKEKLDMDQVPKQSFNRWMLERKVLENKALRENLKSETIDYFTDPIVPSLLCKDEKYLVDPSSESLRREILDDVPMKANMFPRNLEESKGSLKLYIEASRKCINQDNIGNSLSEEEKSKLSEHCSNYDKYLTSANNMDDIMEKLKEMKELVGKPLQEKVFQVADDICRNIAIKSNEMIHTSIKKELVLHFNTSELALDNFNECNSLYDFIVKYFNTMRVNQICGKIRKKEEEYQIILENVNKQSRFSNILTSHQLNMSHYEKLKKHFHHRLNIISGNDSRKREMLQDIFFNRSNDYTTCVFDYFVYCLLLRYGAMFGAGEKRFEGTGLHAACPVEVFETLNKNMNVNSENFASPLNSYFVDFCSACGDLDFWFGSLGGFFEFFPKSGCFESNPPFSEELMQMMVSHMENLLANSVESLSFLIVVPNWMDALSLQRLCSSSFLTHEHVLGANVHAYITGSQHNEKNVHKRKYNAVHETHFFVLQNEKGKTTNPITSQFIDYFLKSFASDSSPPRYSSYNNSSSSSYNNNNNSNYNNNSYYNKR